jgi:hypothetical protein
MLDHESEQEQQMWARELPRSHVRSMRIDHGNVHSSEWLKQLKQGRLAWSYQSIDKIAWRQCSQEQTVTMIVSDKTCIIQAIDQWYWSQWCSWERTVKTINGNEDCQRKIKTNNQLAGDCCCVFLWSKCKDACTHTPKKSLSSLDSGWTQQSIW